MYVCLILVFYSGKFTQMVERDRETHGESHREREGERDNQRMRKSERENQREKERGGGRRRNRLRERERGLPIGSGCFIAVTWPILLELKPLIIDARIRILCLEIVTFLEPAFFQSGLTDSTFHIHLSMVIMEKPLPKHQITHQEFCV